MPSSDRASSAYNISVKRGNAGAFVAHHSCQRATDPAAARNLFNVVSLAQ